jgi:ATP-dependent DNA helicase RecG
MRKHMSQVVAYWAPRMHDPIDAPTRAKANLMELANALQQIHLPDSWEQLRAAQNRLSFDEVFLLQLGVLRQKQDWQSRSGRVFETDPEWLEQRLQALPYSLTNAQQRALEDIRGDLSSGRPMNRLLQGDVGSGKTVIAALAVGMVTRHGSQAALMAPTGILAEQHYRNLRSLLTQTQETEAGDRLSSSVLEPHQVRLLVGSTPEVEKEDIRAGLASGEIKLVIGTHALIEDPVAFADLELTIVDEQHRFGVDQRALLRSKGTNPHLLVMTATPIPRSLALTIYGDLDLSVIDEMPPGRQSVATYVLTPYERERAYRLIRSQIEAGRQAFIIYPLVEEEEKTDPETDTLSAVEERTRLQEKVFPQFKLGLVHGRMKADEKDEVMLGFRNGDYHILVSTTVVEVGVDVPNATVMLIEGANRFGLAQLHQLRGRVGRGAEKSFCLLVAETTDAVENERLQVMAQTNDGFVLAEHDLQQRGPGDFLGKRQSGYAELRLASLTDVHLIDKARRLAQEYFDVDPDLKQPEHQLLASFLERSWSGARGDIS